jgi:membrane protease YdiL (CAAX protease family)
MKPVYRSNLFMLVIVTGQIIGSIFLSRPLQKIFSYNLFLVVTQVLFLLVPVLVYLLATGLPARQTLKLNKLSLKEIGIVIIIGIVAQPVASLLSALSTLFFENTVGEIMKEMGNIPYLAQLGIVALTPAICEEFTMRGIILSGYEKVSRGKAALATGLFFGILHMNPQQFLYAFVLGVLFAYLVRITNSILSTVICHFTFNGIQVTMAYLILKTRPELLNESSDIALLPMGEQILSFIPLILWAALACYIIIRLIAYMERSRNSRNMRYSTEWSSGQSSAFVENGYYNKNESIINLPFIAVIVLYVVLMVLVQLLK